MPMNTRQARVIDPVLSNHIRAYRNAEFVAQALFPRVPVPQRGGTTIEFGKESFRLQKTRRAPGAKTETYQLGYAGRQYGLYQERLKAMVPDEIADEAKKGPGIDLEKAAVETTWDKIMLGIEVEAAGIARDPASYASGHTLALSGTDKWTDSASDPQAQVKDAMATVRRRIGRRPNTMLLSASAFDAITAHPKVKDQFKYTSGKSITADMLKEYFGVRRLVVGEGIYLPETATDDTPATDIWGTDVILAYVPPAGRTYMEPSFAYTYQLRGTPAVEKGWYDRDRKSWLYPVISEHQPLVVGADAGFLLQTVA